MKIDTDQVKKVAKLANLQITADEEEKYSEQLTKILDYIEELNSVNTENVEPTFNVIGNQNILRSDEPQNNLSQEEALLNAPEKKDGFFVTKGVFGGD